MSAEQLPEPSLALFPDKTVQFHRRLDDSYGQNYRDELVTVSVDDIDELEDPELRSALWRQFRSDENHESTALFIFADSQGRHIRSVGIYRKPLHVRFTDQGVEEVGTSSEEVPKHDDSAEIRRAGFIARLFRRMQ